MWHWSSRLILTWTLYHFNIHSENVVRQDHNWFSGRRLLPRLMSTQNLPQKFPALSLLHRDPHIDKHVTRTLRTSDNARNAEDVLNQHQLVTWKSAEICTSTGQRRTLRKTHIVPRIFGTQWVLSRAIQEPTELHFAALASRATTRWRRSTVSTHRSIPTSA